MDDWRTRSACLAEDPDLFFPDGVRGSAPSQMEHARQVCTRCPVQLDCLRQALSTGMTDGVWGGTTPDERRSILRRSSMGAVRSMDVQTLAELRRQGTEEARALSYEERHALVAESIA